MSNAVGEDDIAKDYMLSAKMEEAFGWRKWINEIPYLKFPESWEVKAVPPFSGAIIRYHIRRGDAFVSVYLDCYDRLGHMGEPYWEIHPYYDDCMRYLMAETDQLLDGIETALQQQETDKTPKRKEEV